MTACDDMQFCLAGVPWVEFTPVITALTGTITSVIDVVGFYKVFGALVEIYLEFTIDVNGTGADALNVTIPFIADKRCFLLGQNDNDQSLLYARAVNQPGPGEDPSLVVRNRDGSYPGADSTLYYIQGFFDKGAT